MSQAHLISSCCCVEQGEFDCCDFWACSDLSFTHVAITYKHKVVRNYSNGQTVTRFENDMSIDADIIYVPGATCDQNRYVASSIDVSVQNQVFLHTADTFSDSDFGNNGQSTLPPGISACSGCASGDGSDFACDYTITYCQSHYWLEKYIATLYPSSGPMLSIECIDDCGCVRPILRIGEFASGSISGDSSDFTPGCCNLDPATSGPMIGGLPPYNWFCLSILGECGCLDNTSFVSPVLATQNPLLCYTWYALDPKSSIPLFSYNTCVPTADCSDIVVTGIVKGSDYFTWTCEDYDPYNLLRVDACEAIISWVDTCTTEWTCVFT